MTASAGIHRRDQLEPRRVGDVPLGAGDADAAGFERLTQRFECCAVELRNYVADTPWYPRWGSARGGYLTLALGVSTVRYPIPERIFEYVSTVRSRRPGCAKSGALDLYCRL
jgi:hypothetical protein